MMRRFGVGFAALVVALLMCASAVAQERHYIANDDHTDYFWAGTDEDYRAAFQSMLDYYMQQAEDTADHPHDHRGRFNCDGSLWVYEYENNRSQAEFERLIGHIRDGNISMPMQSLVILPGAMSTETVLRDMYYAGRLERRYDLDFDLAVAMENQTLPAGVASLWAGSGVKYSWKGVCGCVSRLNLEQVERDREIYHFAGPDGQSVVLKWNSLLVNNESLGGYAEARDPSGVVQYMSTDPTFQRVWPWPVKGAFGYGWDDISTTTDAFIVAAQTMSTPQRRVIVSNETDFFEDFVANHGDELETFSGSYGNEWDLLTASLGEVTAKMRRSVEKLRTAEAMATIVALQGTDLAQDRISERNRAFMFMGLYYDHDWTANSGIGVQFREGFQRDTLAAVEGYVDGLYNDAQSSLADMIANPDPTGVPLMVFNPLSWARTDVARMPLTLDGPVHVIDQDTGAEVPSQVDTIDGERFIVILASDVPPVGYRTYRVLPGVGDPFDDAATVDGNTVDNSLYGLTLADDGAITSIIDHCQNDRQLVADGGALGRLNAPGGGGQISVEAQGPVLVRMKVTVPGPPARETRITVYRDINRIDLDNTITQNFTQNLGYQFDLAMGDFTTRHEEVGAIATAKRIAQGGTYADSLARTDYLTLGHFANMAESGFSATLSSWDSSFMKLGNSGVDTLDTTTPSLTAVVGMQVDGPDLGIRNQGGDSRFVNRYALRTHGNYDQAGSMRFAMAHQNPFVAAPLTGGPDSPLPPALYSLLGIDSDEVLAWAIKPAEEGIEHGIIARVWNLSETPESFELRPRSVRLDAATHTTHVETDIAPITVPDGALVDTLARQQLRTYRLTVSEQIVDPPEDVGPPDAGNDVDPEPDPMPDPEPEPEPDPNPEPDPQPEPEPDPMPDVGAMMDASDAPDAEPDPNPEPEPEPDVGDPEPDIDLMDVQEPDAMDAEDDIVVIEDAPMDVPEPQDIPEDTPDVIIPEDLAQSEDADICADLPSGDDPFDDPDPNPDPQPGPEPDPMPDPNPTADTGNPDVDIDGSITDTGESPEPGIAPSDPGDCDCTVPGHTPDRTPWPLLLLVAIVGLKLREKTRD